jgi:hypothetical protein
MKKGNSGDSVQELTGSMRQMLNLHHGLYTPSGRSHFPHHVVDVFFSADDRQEYLGLLSRSASKHVANFFSWCLTCDYAHFAGRCQA